MQLSTYLPAPAADNSVVYRLTSDGNSSASLWVNGQCDTAGGATTCGSDNTATTSRATAEGDALNLVVQYVRNGTAVSGSDPVTITVEQQIDGGAWTALALGHLDPALNLRTSVASSDTLSEGGSPVTLKQTTAWDDPVFRTQASVTYPGLDGNLVIVPDYEADYDPTNSQWKRLDRADLRRRQQLRHRLLGQHRRAERVRPAPTLRLFRPGRCGR